MSLTAHKIRQTFHVSYDAIIGEANIVDELQTEAGDTITTESLLPITTEYFETGIIRLRAHKVGRNSFIATNRRITGG